LIEELLAAIHVQQLNFIMINSFKNRKLEAKMLRKSSIKNTACKEIPTYICSKYIHIKRRLINSQGVRKEKDRTRW